MLDCVCVIMTCTTPTANKPGEAKDVLGPWKPAARRLIPTRSALLDHANRYRPAEQAGARAHLQRQAPPPRRSSHADDEHSAACLLNHCCSRSACCRFSGASLSSHMQMTHRSCTHGCFLAGFEPGAEAFCSLGSGRSGAELQAADRSPYRHLSDKATRHMIRAQLLKLLTTECIPVISIWGAVFEALPGS